MGFKNTPNANLSYYKGIIREISSKLNNALVRINKLEKQLRKMHRITPVSNDSINSMTTEQEEQLIPDTGGLGFGGLSEADVRDIVNDAIEQQLLKIPIHDHTADDKGGDCYAILGATLQ